MSFRIMLAGGGTGGHVYPLVAVSEELLAQESKINKKIGIRFIGDGELMAQAAKDLKLSFRHVMAPKWRRYGSFKNILDLFKIPVGLLQACFHVWAYMPDVMLVKGGYASFLPALMAKLLFVPIIVHESDSVPGKVNLFWGRHCRRVYLAFEHARQYFRTDRTEVIGNPIRPEILAIHEKNIHDKPVVFITGGSQGAQAINEAVDLAMTQLSKDFLVIHQRDGSWNAEQMAQAYADADVIVSRAGSAIFEIAAAGKPVVLIPLVNSAQDHQETNAQEFARHGAIILEQENLLPHVLMNEIKHAYEQREELGQQAKAFAKPDAAAIIAKELLAVA